MKTMTYCRIARLTTAIAAFASASALFAERQPYERYKSVVDRQMFGQPPPGFDPTKPPSEVSAKEEREKEQELTQEQEQVKSAIHFSMVNVTPSGDTAVGFTDNSDSKNPKHYYLKKGESRDGWTVKDADALKATMTIAKGEIEVALTLGGNSASGGGTTSKAGAGRGSFAGRPGLTGGRMGGLGGGANRGLGSLRERRALREQQRAADAQAAAEKEAQRERERAAEKARYEQERAEEKARHDAEQAETQKRLMEMAEEIKRQREESSKAAEKKDDADAKEGNDES